MKTFITAVWLLMGSLLLLSSCGTKNPGNNQGPAGDPADTPVYASAKAAAEQAQADLLSALDSGLGLNLGVDRATLASAVPGPEIAQAGISFKQLLLADSMTTLRQMADDQLNVIVPLMNKQSVATVVGLSRSEEGWQVAELAGQATSNDLNEVLAATGAAASAVTVYQVPNLQATVYAVNRGQEYVSYHTSYNGRSIQEGYDERGLLQQLKADAVVFQRTYGNELQKQQLVR